MELHGKNDMVSSSDPVGSTGGFWLNLLIAFVVATLVLLSAAHTMKTRAYVQALAEHMEPADIDGFGGSLI